MAVGLHRPQEIPNYPDKLLKSVEEEVKSKTVKSRNDANFANAFSARACYTALRFFRFFAISKLFVSSPSVLDQSLPRFLTNTELIKIRRKNKL